jgi:YD repeat-containing protein
MAVLPKDQIKEYFNTAGYETAITDPDGQTVSYSYNSSNEPTLVQAPDGGLTTFSYSGTQATQIAEPGGRTLSLAYSSAGDLTKVTEADGGLRTFAYDTSHRLTNEQYGPLNTTYSYSSSSELSQINQGLSSTLTVSPANAVALATSTAVNSSAVLGVLTDALSHATTYTMDGQGRLTELQTPDGGTQTWNLDLYGQPYNQTDAAGRSTGSIYSYDAGSGDTTGVSNPDGSTSAALYDSTHHNPTQLTDTLGRLTTMTYTANGDLQTTKDALGDVTTQSWSSGLVQTVTDPLGHVTTYLYNSDRQLTTVIDALGDRTTYGYDVAGDQTSVQDANGNITTTQYDALGRVTLTKDALGDTTTTKYDAIGDVTSVTDHHHLQLQPAGRIDRHHPVRRLQPGHHHAGLRRQGARDLQHRPARSHHHNGI